MAGLGILQRAGARLLPADDGLQRQAAPIPWAGLVSVPDTRQNCLWGQPGAAQRAELQALGLGCPGAGCFVAVLPPLRPVPVWNEECAEPPRCWVGGHDVRVSMCGSAVGLQGNGMLLSPVQPFALLQP